MFLYELKINEFQNLLICIFFLLNLFLSILINCHLNDISSNRNRILIEFNYIWLCEIELHLKHDIQFLNV